MTFNPSIEKKVKNLAATGCVFAFLAVLFGAFGAHALRSKLSPYALEVFQTGVYYQMIHALAIFACAWILQSYQSTQARYAANCFIAGIIIFSGSLIFLALSGIKKWGMITPIGGLLFLIGWALLFISILKRRV